jgi:hypothetical protein
VSRDQVKQVVQALEQVVDGLPYLRAHPVVAAVWGAIKATVLSDAVIDLVFARLQAARP